ncbi:SF-assemblin/beta giardin family protein (macronuclear) [Tetrahymena thermophila SB210]|uniref:SF-assemblin/beta giardin family protein n=1 Tax=Tetrahymena thermophila (strain SB210) TaxID=312017 RepID=I7M0P2_TETTS|nr:SF-assemblin/beta giardin family protein [Tetrahymena thermophila SB210]EAR89969.2 SF-assemblin/beta giardin family protein [Tetrahymena thermophila SB210]|eukprot:XP_001010214.2 SF-assemblin/beta giardin family protein [Tetrahymena thermophila SB210]
MLKQKNIKQFFLIEFGKQNKTQLIMTTIFLIPTTILLISTIISLFYFQQISLGMIDDFAENLYQDQISNSKIVNTAVVQQINGQVQKIAWHFNMINQFYGKLLFNSVKINNNFKPAFLNQYQTSVNKGNQQVLNIFQKNPLLTSTWTQPNFDQLQQLNETSLQYIFQASHLDFIWRSIKYDDKIENFRWMQIQTMYYGYASDGMLFGMGSNGTTKGYIIPPGCPYNDQPFLFDLRCRFYYQPTIKNISISVFPPAINFNYGTYYFATNICQRIKKYSSQNADSESSVYAILCSTLNLKSISTYFINFSKNSVYQRLLDPRQLSLVYDSNTQIKSVTQIQDIETNYLQDQLQAQNYLGEINAHSEFVLQETDTINLSNPYSYSQNTFEYNRNGTKCFAILNSVIMIDKVPKQETLKTVNPAKKYQIKNIYLFMDVLSKKNMQIYAQNLQDTIIFYNKIFLYISWGLIILMLFFLIIYSILIGFSIFQPVIHLKNILDQIKVQNQKEKLKQPLSTLQYSFAMSSRTLTDENNEILIDDQLDADLEGYCLSSETQDLLNSFQNVFQTLKFTTKNFFGQNQSMSLLNLNNQVDHFKQFKNLRALGICYNNMGIIHLNSQRYQEALENFGNSLVYSKYELGAYAHEEVNQFLNQQLYDFKILFKNFLLNSLNQEQNLQLSRIVAFVENYKQQNKISYIDEDIEYLFQNLFNRNLNFQISQIFYLQQQNLFLWDLFEDMVIENIAISQLYLSPSQKREIQSYCNLLSVYFNNQIIKCTNGVLNIIMEYYLSIFENDPSKNISLNDSKSKELEFQNSFQSKVEYLANQDSIHIKKNLKNQFESIIITSPIQTRKSKQIKKDYQNRLDFSENMIDSKKSFEQSLNTIFNQMNKEKSKSLQQQIIQQKIQKGYQNQNVNKILKSKQTQDENQSQNINYLQDSSQKIFQGVEISNQQLLQKEINVDSYQRKISNFVNTSLQKNNKMLKTQINKEYPLKQANQYPINKQVQNTNLNKFINLLLYSNLTKQVLKLSLNKVRKEFKANKQNIYDYSSDVYFQYCTIQQASFQILQQNYYTAALILIKSLEECKYYLPYLKRMQINFLSKIFQENNLPCAELQEIKNKYETFTNCNFNIYIISTCYNKYFQKRLCALCCDIINEILFKDDDTFGLLNYNFEQQIFTQTIGVTSIKTIQSNFQLFSKLFLMLFQRDSKLQEQNTIAQRQTVISQQTEFVKENNLNSLKKKQNQIQSNEKLNSKSFKDTLKNRDETQPKIQYIQGKEENQHTEYSMISLFNTEPAHEPNNLSQDIQRNETQLTEKQNMFTNQNNILSKQLSLNSSNNSYKSDEILQETSDQFKYFGIESQISQKKNLTDLQQSNTFKSTIKKQNSFESSKSSDNEMQNLINYSHEDTVISFCNFKQDSNQTSQIKKYKQNFQTQNSQKQKSEQVFILGILACLKQFVFNLDEKLTTFMAKQKFRNQNQQQLLINNSSYTYLIYVTDQKLNLKNKILIQKLIRLLVNLQIQLLVLNLNQNQSLEEYKIPSNIYENGRQVITFFSSEEKLQQYIYNNREHIKNCYQTTIVEHF